MACNGDESQSSEHMEAKAGGPFCKPVEIYLRICMYGMLVQIKVPIKHKLSLWVGEILRVSQLPLQLILHAYLMTHQKASNFLSSTSTPSALH